MDQSWIEGLQGSIDDVDDRNFEANEAFDVCSVWLS